MEPIKQKIPAKPKDEKPQNIGEVIERTTAQKKRIMRGVLNNTGIFIGVFIVFVVIVVYTTEIKFTSIFDWASLGLSFFILMFCTFSMYVNCSDSGMKAGKSSTTYINAQNAYDELKKEVINRKVQGRLPEFCLHFIDEELRNSRNTILTEVGIDFDLYQKDFIGKDKAALEKFDTLSEAQIKAIVEANAIKPIKLTAEMILQRGRGSAKRNTLNMRPSKKRRINYSIKFVKTFLVSALIAVVGFDMVISPSWAMFAACLLKLFPVVLNGFMGYKAGYENIVVDTVNYIEDQADLMQQFIHYVEETPPPSLVVKVATEVETVSEIPKNGDIAEPLQVPFEAEKGDKDESISDEI